MRYCGHPMRPETKNRMKYYFWVFALMAFIALIKFVDGTSFFAAKHVHITGPLQIRIMIPLPAAHAWRRAYMGKSRRWHPTQYNPT